MNIKNVQRLLKLGKHNYNKVSLSKNICQIHSLELMPIINKPNEEILQKIAPKSGETESKPEEFT